MIRRWMTVALALVALVAGLSGPADASGADVMKWQRRLNALHCDAGPVDGKTGTWTRSAIIRFQSRHGMAQTGSFTAPRAPACSRPTPSAATYDACRPAPGPAGAS